jgi:hypothetical protein
MRNVFRRSLHTLWRLTLRQPPDVLRREAVLPSAWQQWKSANANVPSCGPHSWPRTTEGSRRGSRRDSTAVGSGSDTSILTRKMRTIKFATSVRIWGAPVGSTSGRMFPPQGPRAERLRRDALSGHADQATHGLGRFCSAWSQRNSYRGGIQGADGRGADK